MLTCFRIFREGNNGPWSIVNIHVGTPPQPLRVLPSIFDSESFVILRNSTQSSCPFSSPPNCLQLFDASASSTWHATSSHQVRSINGGFAEAECGFDAAGIGLPGTADITPQSQAIIGYGVDVNTVGFLGLHPYTRPVSTFDPNVTMLASLKTSNNIPSLSYAYSADARYRKCSWNRKFRGLDELN